MNDTDLISFLRKGNVVEARVVSSSLASSTSKSVPDVKHTGILIRKIFTIFKCFPDGTYELVSTNSWIDKAGLPQKEKKQVKEIQKTAIEQVEVI